jgi:hypothetical protein
MFGVDPARKIKMKELIRTFRFLALCCYSRMNGGRSMLSGRIGTWNVFPSCPGARSEARHHERLCQAASERYCKHGLLQKHFPFFLRSIGASFLLSASTTHKVISRSDVGAQASRVIIIISHIAIVMGVRASDKEERDERLIMINRASSALTRNASAHFDRNLAKKLLRRISPLRSVIAMLDRV